jgi:hypothetical protein
MDLRMQKALLLAQNLDDFIKYVYKNYEDKNSYRFHSDKLYQVKLFIEEYKFQILADELWRINQYEWDGKYTHLLVDSFIKGINVIDEFVNTHPTDLFLLMARLHTLKSLSFAMKHGDGSTASI